MTAGNVQAIAIDAMGCESGVSVCIEATLQYLNQADGPLRVVLVGDEKKIAAAIAESKQESALRGRIDIEHAEEAIPMGSPASDGIKRKNSSVAVAVQLQREGRVQATISPGHTGAFMAASLFTLGRLRNVSRPAIATSLPTETGRTLILDVGANANCKAQNLYEFAIMGSVYCENVLKFDKPRVGLLSIGEERTKGNELTLATYDILSGAPINFVGNIEGRDILRGEADVVVCDGFIGNILLKFAESVKGFVFNKFRHQIRTNWFSRFGALLMGPFLRRLRQSFDYSEVGGAPLLGVRGVCIVAHGRSSSKAIYNAIEVACSMIKSDVNHQINLALTNGARKPAETR